MIVEKLRKALVLVNVGTPTKPTVVNVSRYLFEFLNDKKVIDLPWLWRKLLVNFIIVPFRARKSTKLYKELWTPMGSPLLVNLNNLVEKLQEQVGEEYTVLGAMRYQEPSLKDVMKKIKKENYQEISLLPLFPQFASATSGTIINLFMREIQKWNYVPSIKIIGQFYKNGSFIESYAQQISSYSPGNFDHVLFSYHGLPLRQVNKMHPGIKCSDCNCNGNMVSHGAYCYKATCYETTDLLIHALKLDKNKCTTTFQSRLSTNWLSPFTDKTLVDLARRGTKRVLIAVPSFVADCLETIVEIGKEYQQLFLKNGGEELILVESLNSHDHWVRAIHDMVNEKQLDLSANGKGFNSNFFEIKKKGVSCKII